MSPVQELAWINVRLCLTQINEDEDKEDDKCTAEPIRLCRARIGLGLITGHITGQRKGGSVETPKVRRMGVNKSAAINKTGRDQVTYHSNEK